VISLAGGRVSYTPTRLTDQATKIFDEALKNKLQPKIRNVFISFHIEDEAQVDLLRHQAKDNQFGIQFRDYSVKEPFDSKWKTNCRERIAQTSATIVMIGPETSKREAVNWEINESIRQGKKVIGVKLYEDRKYPIPKPLIDNNCPIIEWNLAKISKLLTEP